MSFFNSIGNWFVGAGKTLVKKVMLPALGFLSIVSSPDGINHMVMWSKFGTPGNMSMSKIFTQLGISALTNPATLISIITGLTFIVMPEDMIEEEAMGAITGFETESGARYTVNDIDKMLIADRDSLEIKPVKGQDIKLEYDVTIDGTDAGSGVYTRIKWLTHEEMEGVSEMPQILDNETEIDMERVSKLQNDIGNMDDKEIFHLMEEEKEYSIQVGAMSSISTHIKSLEEIIQSTTDVTTQNILRTQIRLLDKEGAELAMKNWKTEIAANDTVIESSASTKATLKAAKEDNLLLKKEIEQLRRNIINTWEDIK